LRGTPIHYGLKPMWNHMPRSAMTFFELISAS